MSEVTVSGNEMGSACMTLPQAADYLGMAIATLNRWRCHGEGPMYLKIGRSIRYRKSDLDEFLNSCERKSTSEVHM